MSPHTQGGYNMAIAKVLTKLLEGASPSGLNEEELQLCLTLLIDTLTADQRKQAIEKLKQFDMINKLQAGMWKR